ncbi:LacI family DNA-binding transcriptional regulator [Pseudarthrobacter sp. P1]|uniref:LacI family DNA-binding transcriptional regulator n=1 Tax=Pseudarthrobacter sp. P1 TaxID=3418418 RepID=UPI003CECED8A
MAEPDHATLEPLKVRMDDVALLARVSRATVSRVLVGHPPVSAATREKVFNAVRELGYVPNMMARGLATRSSDLVGLLLRDPRNPAYGLLHSQIQSAASAQGLQLVTAVPHWAEAAEDELAALRRLLGLRVGGLLVSTGVIKARDLEPFLESVPVVSVGRVEDHPGIYGVSYDEDTNGAILADAVAAVGHRAVAVLVTGSAVSTAENRRGTSMAARLEGHGIQVVRVAADKFGTTDEGNEDIVGLVQERRVTAAMFPNDARAVAFLRHARAASLDVPGDVSVTGCDGAGLGLDLLGLATLRIPVEAVASRALEVLADLMRDRSAPVRHELYPGVFVPGSTLAPPPPR